MQPDPDGGIIKSASTLQTIAALSWRPKAIPRAIPVSAFFKRRITLLGRTLPRLRLFRQRRRAGIAGSQRLYYCVFPEQLKMGGLARACR